MSQADPRLLVADNNNLLQVAGRIPFRWSDSAIAGAAGWGLIITLLQVALAIYLADGHPRFRLYYRLFAADSGWYQSIVDNGYVSPPVLTPQYHGNVAFFPGYPLFVRLVKSALSLDTRTAALLASQLAAWAFWSYLLLFLHRWRLNARLRMLGVLLVAAHPAAFFLVAGYSESLFLMNVLGFLYWASSHRRNAGFLAAAHGFVMTATRLVGLPVVVFPLVLVLLKADANRSVQYRPQERPMLRALLLGAAASAGALLFIAYCTWRFGAWDLYAKTEKVGWSVSPDYLGLFSLRIFHIHWPCLSEPMIDPQYISRLTVPVAVLLLALAAVAEWRLARRCTNSGWRFRLGLYVCAFFLLYVPVAAHYTRGMSSMTRFALCVQTVLALAAVHLLTRMNLGTAGSRRLTWICGVWCAASFAVQLMLTWRFVHGLWVA
jgi:hypothetical protein